MSMLEKMARRLAQDALERVQPGIYTSVVDGISLYQMLDGNYQVGANPQIKRMDDAADRSELLHRLDAFIQTATKRLLDNTGGVVDSKPAKQ